MLTQTLREMERDGLLSRRVYKVVPPKVEYSLTPLGRKFIEPLEMLYDWGRANADALDQLGQRAGSKDQARRSTALGASTAPIRMPTASLNPYVRNCMMKEPSDYRSFMRRHAMVRRMVLAKD